LAARREGIGASEIAALIGDGTIHPYLTALDVWNSKMGVAAPQQVGEAAEWGNLLEHIVARVAQRRHGDEIGKVHPSPGLVQHEQYPWMLATPDRVLTHGETPTALLEVKTVSRYVYQNSWLWGNPPDHIMIQVQQQMAVTGMPRTWVSVLVGGQWMPKPVLVERDDDTIELLTKQGDAWWRRHIGDGERPELTYHPSIDAGTFWPADEDAEPAVMLDDEQREIVERFTRAHEAKRVAEQALKRAAFDVRKLMDERTSLVDDDGKPLLSLREESRESIDVELLRERFPDVARECVKVASPRVLRIAKTVRDE